MTEQKIKQGDWFCAIEGLAIADKIFYFYFEEFDKIPQNKNVGDYKMSVIQYRLFCDFDGNPIKRNRFKIFNAEYVSPITPKYERVLKKSIKENPKEYASFVKFLKTSKEMKGHVTINYALKEDNKEEVIQNLNTIRGKLHSKFTFIDFVKIKKECQCVINMNNILDDIADTQLYVRIYLIYKFEDSLGKRILFNDLDFEIKGGKL
ncbi:hypothetical protein [Segatella copri]|uniref:hypothetical protein n=1 Tax=Segatella copri TaxID=165179 RepID=UPI00294B51EA|nr:hypothetical protein [Segatella copri]